MTASPSHIEETTMQTTTYANSQAADNLSTIITRYLDWLKAEGIADPLAEPVTVACVLADLCALAGIEEPSELAEYFGPGN